MSIEVKIVADSVNPAGVRLTSWLLKFQRFILAEFNTHRVFSRNAASSRAIPFQKMQEAIMENPAMPERYGSEQKGMQSSDEVGMKEDCRLGWLDARDEAVSGSDYLHRFGLHKSLCNRLLEPFSHITVLATATNHSNFFALRAHPEAMPEFQVLAYRMLDQYLKHNPREIQWGYWHIPSFKDGISEFERVGSDSDRIRIATARCARLSYLTHNGEHSPEKDIELHDRLLASGHLSPMEHCAQADEHQITISNFDQKGLIESDDLVATVSLSGWTQYRQMIPNENQTNVDLASVLKSKPEWIQP